jgi:predicted secreted acid phosphatase
VKQKAIIVDLDGTLCNIEHRMDLFRNKQYKQFESMLIHDEPNQILGHFLQFARFRGWKLLFVSARTEDARDATKEWLSSHFPGFEKFPLFLRGRKDFRLDFEVKRQIYNNEIKPDYDVVLVLDDRSTVVEEWRRLGLQCWQVAEGNY